MASQASSFAVAEAPGAVAAVSGAAGAAVRPSLKGKGRKAADAAAAAPVPRYTWQEDLLPILFELVLESKQAARGTIKGDKRWESVARDFAAKVQGQVKQGWIGLIGLIRTPCHKSTGTPCQMAPSCT